MDPFIASAKYLLSQTIEDYRRSLEGLTADALNWRPADSDTNSLAVLTFHAWSSTRWWLSTAVGAPLPDRDRDSEFLMSTADAKELRAWFEDIAKQCDGLLDTGETVDWSAMSRPNPDDPQEVPASFALLHAMAHLREHEGQMSLTRQLWKARQ